MDWLNWFKSDTGEMVLTFGMLILTFQTVLGYFKSKPDTNFVPEKTKKFDWSNFLIISFFGIIMLVIGCLVSAIESAKLERAKRKKSKSYIIITSKR